MEYTTLGSTGMRVSRIGLGCMSFGSGSRKPWVLDAEDARTIIERAIELGVTFFDTANIYSYGESERILGEVLAEHERDRLVVASKGFRRMDRENPNAGGLSRKAVEQELANSLDRLDLDTLDLYQIHRWDPNTPIEETLRALTDAVRRGRIRTLGASSMWAHQFASALYASEANGYARFETMQNHWNLVYREEEREMVPLCRNHGVGMIPYSPLARGYLARPDGAFSATDRGQFMDETDRYGERIAAYRSAGGTDINARVQELAEEKGASMAQIALAWLLDRPGVDAPIVGTSSVEHLEEAVGALSISLSDSEGRYLEESYEPRPVVGHE